MKINRQNYEETLIDYMEGKLSQAEEGEVLLFLNANPDIKEEFEMLQNEVPSISAMADINFPLKEKLLKKQIGKDFVDEFTWLCIAKVEGDATPQEIARLQQLIRETPSLSEEFNIFLKAKLIPSVDVVYDRKRELARHRIGLLPTIGRFAVAASVAAIMIVISFPIGDSIVIRQESSQVLPTTSVVIAKQNPISSRQRVAVASNDSYDKIGLSGDSATTVNSSDANQKVLRRDSEQLVASISPVDPSVNIQVDENIALHSTTSDSELVRTMNPAENPSRYLTVGEFLADKIAGPNTIDPNFGNSSAKAKFWQVAQVGIKGVSRILGIPVKIEKEYDSEGNLKKISIDSKLLALSREL